MANKRGTVAGNPGQGNESGEAIRASGLSKHYKRREDPALTDVSFTIRDNEVVGLLGPNGAGKTTLLKILCGIIPPTSGSVRVLGNDPTTEPLVVKRKIGVVHQRTTFDLFLSAYDNLAISAAFQGLKWQQIKARVDGMIDSFQLNGKCRQPVFTLSGGEQRRLQVIRALLRVPELLLLDEPSAGLDVSGRRHVWAIVEELRRDHGVTIVWTSHYVEELERNCDRIMIIDKGRVARMDSPTALVSEFGRTRATLGLSQPDDQANAVDIVRAEGMDAVAVSEGIEIEGNDVRERLPRLLAALQRARIEPGSIQIASPSLEDAYLRLVEGAPHADE